MKTIINPDALRKARDANGLTQTEASQAIGIAQCTLSLIEGGHKQSSINVLAALARLYQVSVESLLTVAESAA